MILFKTISSFRKRIATLLKVRRNVYAGIISEIQKEFEEKRIDQIRQNNDMILMNGDLMIIKLRLPDKKQRLSRKDGFRLIYLVSKVESVEVFLDIYPKNAPLQQLDIDGKQLKQLITEFVSEGESGILVNFPMP